VPVLLLDLDRTLVDLQSATDYDAAWADVRDLVDPALAEAGPATGWSTATRACMGVIAALTDVEQWRAVSTAIERHERDAIARSTPMPDVHEFLAATTHLSRAVVTLLPESVARDVLAMHGIDVAVVVGRDPNIRPKPSGDGLREALRRLGSRTAPTPDDVTMVGDSTWDAAAAADAGTGFVGVHAGAAEFAGLVPAVPAVAGLLDVVALLDERRRAAH
jgi:phosphoglycolate phosphatase-like HAD superfamily hydrolase